MTKLHPLFAQILAPLWPPRDEDAETTSRGDDGYLSGLPGLARQAVSVVAPEEKSPTSSVASMRSSDERSSEIGYEPSSPPILDHDCADHGVPLPCPKCTSDAGWLRKLRESARLEKQADEIESMTLTDQSDREHLRWFANDLRRRASQIRGELGAIADREAREAEDAQKPHQVWRPVG